MKDNTYRRWAMFLIILYGVVMITNIIVQHNNTKVSTSDDRFIKDCLFSGGKVAREKLEERLSLTCTRPITAGEMTEIETSLKISDTRAEQITKYCKSNTWIVSFSGDNSKIGTIYCSLNDFLKQNETKI